MTSIEVITNPGNEIEVITIVDPVSASVGPLAPDVISQTSLLGPAGAKGDKGDKGDPGAAGSSPTSPFVLTAHTPTETPLTLVAASGQNDHLLDIKDESGVKAAFFDAWGQLSQIDNSQIQIGSLRMSSDTFYNWVYLSGAGKAHMVFDGTNDAQFKQPLAISQSNPSFGGGTGPMIFLGNDLSDPSTNPVSGTILFSSSGKLKARTPDGTVTQIAPAGPPIAAGLLHSAFVPSSLNPPAGGGQYTNPLMRANRNGGNTLNALIAYVMYSGPTAISIDRLEAGVQAAGAAGAVVRSGIYIVSNQSNPFLWSTSTTWATLLADYGTLPTTATGWIAWTPSPATIIPANTWFAVAGVDQVVMATRYLAATLIGGFSPWGSTGGQAYNNTIALGIYMNGVTGALPANFVPTGLNGLDCGIGFRRSA